MPTKNTEAAGCDTVNDDDFYFDIIYSIIKLFYFFQLVVSGLFLNTLKATTTYHCLRFRGREF